MKIIEKHYLSNLATHRTDRVFTPIKMYVPNQQYFIQDIRDENYKC